MLDEKRKALAEYNETFVKIAGWFAAFYRLAGRDDLARGVRPSGHRKGRTVAGLKIGRPRKKRARTKQTEAPTPEASATTPPPSVTPAVAEPRLGPGAVLRPFPIEVAAEHVRDQGQVTTVLEIEAVPSPPARTRRPLPPVRRFLSFLGRHGRSG